MFSRRSPKHMQSSFVQPFLFSFKRVTFHVPSATSARPLRFNSIPTSFSSSSFIQSFRTTLRRPRLLPCSSRSLRGRPLPASACSICCHLNGTNHESDANIVENGNGVKLGARGQEKPASSPRNNIPVRVLVAVVAVAAAAYAVKSGTLSPLSAALDSITLKAQTLGPLRAACLLGCLNFMTVLLCFPANMGLMIAAGAILPAPYAFAALFVSKLVAACAAFVLGRTFLRSRAEQWLVDRPRFQNVLGRSEVTRWTFVLLLRLSPFPGFALNYLLSLTSVPFGQYALGTLVGIAPSIANLVLIGDAAKGVGQTVASGTTLTAWLAPALKLAMVSSMFLVTLHVTKLISSAFVEQSGTASYQENSVESHEGHRSVSHTTSSLNSNEFKKVSPIRISTTSNGSPFDSDETSVFADDGPTNISVETVSQPAIRGCSSRDDNSDHQ